MLEDETFDWLSKMLLNRHIIEWSTDRTRIKLDDGAEIILKDDNDDEWPVLSFGTFEEIKLNKTITEVSDIYYEKYYGGCDATITLKSNNAVIGKVIASADSGEGHYYYSSVHFEVRLPNGEQYWIDFVNSCD